MPGGGRERRGGDRDGGGEGGRGRWRGVDLLGLRTPGVFLIFSTPGGNLPGSFHNFATHFPFQVENILSFMFFFILTFMWPRIPGPTRSSALAFFPSESTIANAVIFFFLKKVYENTTQSTLQERLKSGDLI